MCGIFAYAGFTRRCTMRELIELAVNGLRRLEYRGYDSAGLCVDNVTAGPGCSAVVRTTGNVQKLHDAAVGDNAGSVDLDAKLEKQHTIIAHTRWATHGPPCDTNAHPQSSNDGAFVVVHNGIVTNFHELKSWLQAKGSEFKSETDTEVIAELSRFVHAEGQGALTFAQIAGEVLRLCQGASAIVLRSRHFPGELAAAKRGSPMVVGLRPEKAGGVVHGQPVPGVKCDVLIASDTAPIIDHTRHVVFIEDNEVVHVKGGSVAFYKSKPPTNPIRRPGHSRVASVESVDDSASGAGTPSPNRDHPVQPSELLPAVAVKLVEEVTLELEALSKGQYPHFMLKEIHEQPDAIRNAMRGRVNFAQGEVHMGGIASNIQQLRRARRIVFVACGTSLNACLAVRPLFEQLGQLPVAIENASDFLDREPPVFRDDVMVFVSQSGETADTLRVLEFCETRGAMLCGVTNTVGSAISRKTHFGCHLNCGPEIGVASTKAFTAQVITMTLIAVMMASDSRELAPRCNEILAGLQSLPALVDQTLLEVGPACIGLAEKMVEARSVLVLGRGYQFATAMEGALKVKELTYIHTEGLNTGELKHGPLALIDENIPVVVLCPKDGVVDRVRAAVQQIRARGGRPWVVLTEHDGELSKLAEATIKVPATVDCLQAVINAVPLQLLAYHTAVLRGNNVDCPRNIAKSVTVQ